MSQEDNKIQKEAGLKEGGVTKTTIESNIPPEHLTDIIYDAILEGAEVDRYLDNKHMDISGAFIEVQFGLGSKNINFKLDASKSDFKNLFKNELQNQIESLNLQGSQDIKYLKTRFFAYEATELDKPAEERNSVGGSRNLI